MYQKLRPHLTRRNLITAAAFLIAAYIGFSTIGVITRNYQLQKQVDKLEEEIEILSLQNRELEYQITYYRTDAFAEKEARDKLGLQAPGERVVIFPDKVPKEVVLATAKPKDESLQAAARSNFDQWMYFLFGREPKTN